MLVIAMGKVAAAIGVLCFSGVAIGVGLVFASLIYSIARNPAMSQECIRWAFIGFSLVEASGLIGLVMGFIIMTSQRETLQEVNWCLVSKLE